MKAAASLLVLCFAGALATEALYNYTPTKAGDWMPPNPPAKETPHLEGRVPAPSAQELSEVAQALGYESLSTGRKLLQDDAAAQTGGVVPHNWFGTGKYKEPMYSVATGKEECDVCRAMLDASKDSVEKSAGGAGSGSGEEGGDGSGSMMGKKDMCKGVGQRYREMCMGYMNYLESCPSFVHNICHEDLGGSERLRSPCPDYLKCFYCLRINPLFCLTSEAGF